jgi:transposase
MKRYDRVFKEEAVKLSEEVGIKKAAEDLGIPYYTLAGWRQDEKVGVAEIKRRKKKEGSREEELEEEVERLKRVTGILKGALSFFVEEQKR